MRINVDRLAVLAGINKSSNSRNALQEGVKPNLEKEYMKYEMEEDESKPDKDKDDALEEMIEVDEVMLVQELRRAKKIMLENAQAQKAQDLKEASLKKIIEEEVSNIFNDLNLNSGWVYGNKKPARSRNGVVHQGSYLKGIGFK